MSQALDYIKREPWWIQKQALETIGAIATRQLSDVEAIERSLGEKHDEARGARVTDGVAIVSVHGPMFRYANLFTRMSGATSTEVLANEIGALLDDPAVRAIVLDVDSPGGTVNGTSEIAELVFRAREEKPVYAFVSGLGASAAYYIASAASQVYVANSAIVGSIGTVLSVTDFTEADERRGIRTMEFVSAQSPKKRMDPFSSDDTEADEARAELQNLVNSLADVFVTDVARFRGVPVDTVLSDFGQGGVFIGAQCVDAGMADGVTTLEDLKATLVENRGRLGHPGFRLAAELPQPPKSNPEVEESMSAPEKDPAAEKQPEVTEAYLEQNHADLVQQLRDQGAAAERERISAIHSLRGPEDLKAECIAEGVGAGDAALKINAAQKAADEQRAANHLRERTTAEEGLDAPSPSADPSEGGETQKLVARAVTLHNQLKGEKPPARA